MIEFACETCGAVLQVADDLVGKKGKCQKCGAVVTVPPSKTAATANAPRPSVQSPPARHDAPKSERATGMATAASAIAAAAEPKVSPSPRPHDKRDAAAPSPPTSRVPTTPPTGAGSRVSVADAKLLLGYAIGVALIIFWCYLSILVFASGQLLLQLIWMVTAGTSIWTGFDAATNKIPTDPKQPYQPMTNGGWRWLVCCLVLWIVCFPLYLVTRSKVMRERRGAPPLVPSPTPTPAAAVPTDADVEGELRRFKKLLDDGLITQDDWDRKKQQLLGIG